MPTRRRPCWSFPTTAPGGWTAESESTSGYGGRDFWRRSASPPTRTTPSEVGIDWSKTVAWGEGGYYARVFLNVAGREPEGIVPEAEYESVRDDLAERLGAIPDENGDPLDTKVYKPDEIYEEVNGVAPDLIVHFDDLEWRAVGTIGGDEGIHTFENDTGPDDANHAQEGLLIMAGPGIPAGYREGMHLLDVAPTALDLLGLDTPATMRGRSLVGEDGARATAIPERGRRIVNPHAAPYVRFWWLVVIGVVVAVSPARPSCTTSSRRMPPKLTERTPPSYSATAILMLTSKEQPLVRIGVTTVTPRGPGGAPGPPDVETSPPGLDTLVEAANLLPLTIQSDAVTDLRREKVGDLPGTVTAQALYAHETPRGGIEPSDVPAIEVRPNRPRSTDAVQLVRGTISAFGTWLREQQDEAKVPEAQRIFFVQLNAPTADPQQQDSVRARAAGRRSRSRRVRASDRRPAPAVPAEAASQASPVPDGSPSSPRRRRTKRFSRWSRMAQQQGNGRQGVAARACALRQRPRTRERPAPGMARGGRTEQPGEGEELGARRTGLRPCRIPSRRASAGSHR